MKRVLVLHGPNLKSMLCGGLTLTQLNRRLLAWAKTQGLQLHIFQSNHEGDLLDTLSAKRKWAQGVVVSPSALSHQSYSLRDGIVAVALPAVEVQWKELPPPRRWKKVSVVAPVCRGLFVGEGLEVYLQALQCLQGS